MSSENWDEEPTTALKSYHKVLELLYILTDFQLAGLKQPKERMKFARATNAVIGILKTSIKLGLEEEEEKRKVEERKPRFYIVE